MQSPQLEELIVNSLVQPDATHLPTDLLEAVVRSAVGDQTCRADEIVYRDGHSNDFAEVRLSSGRSLVVKRGRYEWAWPRFATSRVASRLIRERTSVAVPAPLPVPKEFEGRPLEAYWRIDVPTLQELWPELDGQEKVEALRSWGELAERLHSVSRQGYGPLVGERTGTLTLRQYLGSDLDDRLAPAVAAEWPEALGALRALRAHVDEVDARVGGRSCLVHNDLHMGNVLCEMTRNGPRCIGMIDLETAIAAPPEADIAGMEVHHGPHFGQPLEAGWEAAMRAGYRLPIDDWVVNFYRVLHLLNMGFYSALIGHREHAAEISTAAQLEVARLESGPEPLAGLRVT